MPGVLDTPAPQPQYELSPFGWPTMRAPGVARLTPYVPVSPWPVQRVFLMLRCLEAFFGGAAGGSKSWAALMGALQFVDVPGYAALILRKSYTDLSLPGALLDVARSWLGSTDARYSSQEHAWHFPSGAQVVFGYCETDADVRRYQSAAFQYIFVDELTQHSEVVYRFLFSRLRKPAQLDEYPELFGRSEDGLSIADVPLRMRSASNPGDKGHGWVKRRLVDPDRDPRRVFIPARMEDNPGLDVDAYLESLQQTHEIDWLRLVEGDWEVRDPGQILVKTMFELARGRWGDERGIERVRYWDMASTEVRPGKDPDWTAGALIALDTRTGRWCVEDMRRMRGEPHAVEAFLADTAALDGRDVPIVIEQEPGSEGKLLISNYSRHLLRGYFVDGRRTTGDKRLRIRSMAAKAGRGEIVVVEGPWNDDLFDEAEAFPTGLHDDQLDAVAGGIEWLSEGGARLLV